MLFGYARIVANTPDASQRTRILEELGCTEVFLDAAVGRPTELARTRSTP